MQLKFEARLNILMWLRYCEILQDNCVDSKDIESKLGEKESCTMCERWTTRSSCVSFQSDQRTKCPLSGYDKLNIKTDRENTNNITIKEGLHGLPLFAKTMRHTFVRCDRNRVSVMSRLKTIVLFGRQMVERQDSAHVNKIFNCPSQNC